MKLTTKLHTIFMLIGPTECGKSTFAKNILLPQLKFADAEKNYISNVQYLSSDEIRQELLGHPYDKYDSKMLEASGQAFDQLFAKLRAVTTFPINADFVIIDTTGLAEDFRKKVVAIAQEQHYRLEAIVFDYRNIRDYYASERSKKLIANHVNRLRRDVLPTLRRSDFSNIHRIREKNFFAPEQYDVVVEDRDEYLSHLLPHDHHYIIVGDVHECLDELQELITAHGFDITADGKITPTAKSGNKKFLLIGDFIDKGKNTAATIEFLYENRDYFYFTKGNHENFVSKYLAGEIHTVDPDLLANFFDSIPVLAEDAGLRAKFLDLVACSKDFYRLIGAENSSFYVTHAPCYNRYIGKMDPLSRREQRRFATEFGSEMESQLLFLKEESESSYPYHVFGHVATREVIRVKNKIGIDTGCVAGGVLTSVALGGFKPFFKSIASRRGTGSAQLQLAFSRGKTGAAAEVKLVELSEADEKRLNYVLRNKVNFISGTMSPADKNFHRGELESLEKGLDYFRNHGVSEVVLQPKYMGSRCNLYLARELERCYATSRNGYKITKVDLSGVFAGLLEKFTPLMDSWSADMIIFDGELLPWKALGKGLIDKQFEVIGTALETEIAFLKEFGFEQHLGDLVGRYEASDFEAVRSRLPKKQLVEQFGLADYNNFKDLKEILAGWHALEEQDAAAAVYRKQLELYAHDADLEYKPFSMLKIIYTDGSEEIPSETRAASEIFSLISDDEYLVVDLGVDGAYARARAFFEKLTTERGMEGVVIKPELRVGDGAGVGAGTGVSDDAGIGAGTGFSDDAGIGAGAEVVPFMKVRNSEYLTLVYGYNYGFPHKYEKLIKQKSIKKKLQASLAEHKLGMEMLRVRLDEISPDNRKFKQTVANLLFEESKESEIDPRL
ncbi:metallophosphoesterase [Pseudoneobacillus sp. C159]